MYRAGYFFPLPDIPVEITTIYMFKNYRSLWKKFQEGKASKEEKQMLMEFLEEKEGQEMLSSLMQEDWEAADNALFVGKLSNEELFEQIQSRIEKEGRIERIRKIIPNRTWAVAAAAAVAALLAVSGWYFNYKDINRQTILAVEAGESFQQFTLPDGSELYLNAASKVQFPQNFKKNRQITLEGEGFFKVKKGLKSPFSLSFAGHNLLVTGTEFSVKSYQGDSLSLVHVKEGSVNVFSQKDTLSLTLGELALISNDSGTQEELSLDFDNQNSWLKGELWFEEEALEDVFHTFERAYGVGFDLDTSMRGVRKRKINARYKRSTELSEILEGLKYLYQFNCQYITEDSVRVWKN